MKIEANKAVTDQTTSRKNCLVWIRETIQQSKWLSTFYYSSDNAKVVKTVYADRRRANTYEVYGAFKERKMGRERIKDIAFEGDRTFGGVQHKKEHKVLVFDTKTDLMEWLFENHQTTSYAPEVFDSFAKTGVLRHASFEQLIELVRAGRVHQLLAAQKLSMPAPPADRVLPLSRPRI